MFLDNSVDLRTAADSLVNPLTALCLRKLVTDYNVKCVVIDGAITQLGRILCRLFLKEDIQIIAVARDSSQMDTLKNDLNLTRIVDYSRNDFQDLLRNEAYQFDRCCYISMQGGDFPGKILNQLPAKSEMILIGNLAEKDLVISAQNFYFDQKRIRGFFLERFVKDELDENTLHKFYKYIADDLKNGGNLFGTKVAKEMRLEEWDQAIDQIG